MRYYDIVNEGVKIHSPIALAAYMLTVAENYAKAPVDDPAAHPYWEALNKSTMDVLFKQLKNINITVRFVEDDPYSRHTSDTSMMIKYMLYDMVVNHTLEIYSGDNQHPLFAPEENLAFRAVHDFFAHGKLRSMFIQQLKEVAKKMNLTKLPAMDQAGELLQNINMSKMGNRGLLFSGRGELNAASTHIKIAPEKAAPALFTEIIGQVSYQVITHKFGEQKICILQGFDYKNIGVCQTNSPQEQRMKALVQEMEEGAQQIQSAFGLLNVKQLINDCRHGV